MNANRSQTTAKNAGSRQRPALSTIGARFLGAALLALVGGQVQGQIVLGAASGFAGLELGTNELLVSGSGTKIAGNLGVASSGDLVFDGGTDTGSVYAGNYSTMTLTDGSVVSGDIYEGAHDSLSLSGGSSDKATVTGYTGMAAIVTAADNAAASYAALKPKQTLSSITGTTLLVGTSGANVYAVSGNISLGSGQTLTLEGNSSSTFVFNVTGNVTLSNGAMIVLSGMSANQVLFNFVGSGGVSLTGNSDTEGIFLATKDQTITVNGGVQQSSFITDGALTLESCSTLSVDVPPIPEPATYAMWGAVACVSAVVWRRRRSPAGIAV